MENDDDQSEARIVGSAFRRRRLWLGHDIGELARIADVSDSTIRNFETGRIQSEATELVLCRVLSLPSDARTRILAGEDLTDFERRVPDGMAAYESVGTYDAHARARIAELEREIRELRRRIAGQQDDV